jgi:uncharacterized damage-inducible protein DinB
MYPTSWTTERIVATLAEAPPRIAALGVNLLPEQLLIAPEPDAWSVHDVLAHLCSCADVWGGCIHRILAEDAPTFKAVNPTTWIKGTDYREQPFAPLLRAFSDQRGDLLAVLEPLPSSGWQRAATVIVAGKSSQRTVFFYAQWLARHERPHIVQIERAVHAIHP